MDECAFARPAPRQLVKDGVWQVPPDQRPKNWQTMAVRECEETETKTHTRRKRTTEVLIQERQELTVPEPTEAEVVEATLAISAQDSQERFPEAPIISHLPKDGPYVDSMIDAWYEIEVDNPKTNDEELAHDAMFERLWERAAEIVHYRKSKVKVDRALSHWADLHKAQLRHIGLGSAAIKDLWRVFQGGIILEMEDADRRVEEAKRAK